MRRHYWIVLTLIVATVGVFGRVARHDFVNYDDTDYVTRNPRVQAGLTPDGVAWAFGQLHGEATYWHPLTWLSHMLDCQWFGLKPAGHHLVNLLFHTLNSVLVFLVFRRMTGAVWRSALLAALFALHPLQVETVAWIAERKNVLSTGFWLLTIGAYVLYAEKPGPWRYVAVMLAFALGLMAKPMLVTLPCALLLLDFWPLRRFPFSPAAAAGAAAGPFVRVSTIRLMLEKTPLFALAVAVGIITILAHRGLGMTNFAYGVTFDMRVDNALVSYARYVGKALWPADLSVLYIHPGKWPSWIVGGALFFLIVVTGLALREWRRFPYLTVGWLWFLGTLVPVIGLIQVGVQAMANRFAYVPVIGLFLMLVWGVADLFSRWKNGRVAASLSAAAVLAACVILASVHLGHWKTSQTLFEYAVKVGPDNFVAHNNLAFTFIAEDKLDRALKHALEALRIRPDFTEAHYQAGLILNAQQKPVEAIAYLREAVRLDPKWALPHAELARALAKEGQVDEAIAEFSAALRILPDDAPTHGELADLLQRQRRSLEAVPHYRQALRLRPDSPEALNNLAWILATDPRPELRDGPEAVRLADRACQLSGRKRAIFLGTLAAAYAEAGRFGDAVKTAESARDTARAAGEQAIASTNDTLIEVYRAGKAFREGTGP
jgi:tetratricopeptide (TPR) repeat protein